MQMTYEQAMRPGMLQAFARRGSGYMMRSEKRGGSYGGSGRKPPKRKRAGFVYIFFTLLISVLLWPIGMVMLWRRKVRLQAGTKLLISLLTLCVSVFLIVFALTVPLDNVEFTAFQDRANDWLDTAAANIAVAGDATMKKTSETWNVMTDFIDAESQYSTLQAADAIDLGVEAAGKARETIEGWFHREPAEPAEDADATLAPEETEVPEDALVPKGTEAPVEEATEAPVDEATEAPVEEATEAPEKDDAPDAEATEAPDGAENVANILLPIASPEVQTAQAVEDSTLSGGEDAEPAEEATEAPVEEATDAPVDEATAAPVEETTETPVEEATEAPAEEATEAPVEEATEAPTVAPTATPEPEGPYTVKPAGEATVYFYENGSKGFHKSPTRHGMSGAPAHTLAEAFAAGKSPCASCEMPDESVLEIEDIAWVDESNLIHTTEDCEKFDGHWKLMSLEDALGKGYATCADCGADLYAEDLYPTPTPSPEPTPEPTPTPEPEPEIVSPATALKPAGEAVVYYFDASKGYHVSANCVGMNGAPAHTLAEAVAAGKHACGNCHPAAAELLDQPALWLDESGVCHTSDECASFDGQYKLIARDDALAQELAACPDCGAAEYLQPGTALAEN